MRRKKKKAKTNLKKVLLTLKKRKKYIYACLFDVIPFFPLFSVRKKKIVVCSEGKKYEPF